MVPIYYRAVPDADIPEAIARFQRIDFTGTTDFDANFAKLTKTLDTDLDWKHTHTRLLTRAKEWERNGADSSFLLRGKDLSEAEQWIVRSAEKEPKPTALHSQYILTSRQAAPGQTGIVLPALDGVHGLPRYTEMHGKVCLRPVTFSTQNAETILHQSGWFACNGYVAITKCHQPSQFFRRGVAHQAMVSHLHKRHGLDPFFQ